MSLGAEPSWHADVMSGDGLKVRSTLPDVDASSKSVSYAGLLVCMMMVGWFDVRSGWVGWGQPHK